MFYNWFQTGASLELYNPNSKDTLINWLFIGNNKKSFDKPSKSYVHLLDVGGMSKMQTPKSKREFLGIVQGFLVFQLYLFSSKEFSIEVAISDTMQVKHRLIFSTQLRNFSVNYFTCLIPMVECPIGVWCNLSLDILGFVSYCFKVLTFKSIDSITLSANCKIRRIFTMRNPLKESYTSNNSITSESSEINEREKGFTDIPKKFEFNANGLTVLNINMNVEKIRYWLAYRNENEYKRKAKEFADLSYLSSQDNLNSGRSISGNKDKSVINYMNFGEKQLNQIKKKVQMRKSPSNMQNCRVVNLLVTNQRKIIQQKEKANLKVLNTINENLQDKNVRNRYNTNIAESNSSDKPSVKTNSHSRELDKQFNTVGYVEQQLVKKGSIVSIEEIIQSKIMNDNINDNEIEKESNAIFVDPPDNMLMEYKMEDKQKSKDVNRYLKENKKEEFINDLLKESTLKQSIGIKQSRERPYSPPIKNYISAEIKKEENKV